MEAPDWGITRPFPSVIPSERVSSLRDEARVEGPRVSPERMRRSAELAEGDLCIFLRRHHVKALQTRYRLTNYKLQITQLQIGTGACAASEPRAEIPSKSRDLDQNWA